MPYTGNNLKTPSKYLVLWEEQLSIKPTRELMRFAWKTETMVLRDHKVGITEQSQDRLGNLNVLVKWDLPREKLRAPGPKTNIILRKTTWS